MLDLRSDQRVYVADRRPTICLIVDVANISEDAILPLTQELRRRGSLAAMFAFGDWHRRDMHLRHRLLDALGFLCIHGGSWENGSGGLKSMVDSIMKRTIKWMPQWFPTCDTYVLATGDRDFSHDASDLRWRGFQVWIAAGEASINNELRLGADEFISLDRLPGRAPLSTLLGVPANYYETTFGARRAGRPFSAAEPPAPRPIEPPPPVVSRPAPIASRPAPAMPPAPVAPVIPVASAPLVATGPVMATITRSAPAVTNAEDRQLLEQLRELAGQRGYVAQREALRVLAPADDPGGRVRSRLSNQIRDLVERTLLIRTQATIGGNATQVLTLPGWVIEAAAHGPARELEPPSERRGRIRSRRRVRGEVTDESTPSALAEVPAEPEVAQSVAVAPEPVAPVRPVAPVAPVRPVASVAPAPSGRVIDEPWVAAPAARSIEPVAHSVEPAARVVEPARIAPAADLDQEVADEEVVAAPPVERGWEPARPVVRRPERPAVRAPQSVAAPEPTTPAPTRPSWKDQVAAALARVRGEDEGDGRSAQAPAARVSLPAAPMAPPLPVTEAIPPAPQPVVEAPARQPVVQAPDLQPAVEAPVVIEASAGLRHPLVDGAPAPPVAGDPPVGVGAISEVDPSDELVLDQAEPTGPARRRRRRRPASSVVAETPSSETATESLVTLELAPPVIVAVSGQDPTVMENAAPSGETPARRRPPRRRRRPTSGAGEPETPTDD